MINSSSVSLTSHRFTRIDCPSFLPSHHPFLFLLCTFLYSSLSSSSLHVQLRWIKPPRPGWFNFFFLSILLLFLLIFSCYFLSVSRQTHPSTSDWQSGITSLLLFTFIIPKQHRITLLIHMDIKAYAHIKAKTYNAPLNTNLTVCSKTANPYFLSLTSSLATCLFLCPGSFR